MKGYEVMYIRNSKIQLQFSGLTLGPCVGRTTCMKRRFEATVIPLNTMYVLAVI